MTNTRYPQVKLAGTPKERGRLYGGACRSMIDASIRNYADMFSAFSGISWESAKALAIEYLPFIRDYCPKAVDEMEGIAEGSGRDFGDIIALNVRSEIVLDRHVDGCTAFGVSPAASADGDSYVCQNWDWIRRQRDSVVVVTLEQPPEPTLTMIAEAGMVGGRGLNDAGLGLCFNALSTGKGKPGVPVHILLRGIMDSRTLSDAVQSVALAKRASSANFVVGTSEGEIIDIEACPEDYWVFYAERGWLAHTNHFTAPNLVGRVPDTGKTILPDTFQRLGRINALLSASEGCVDFDRCAELLSDHANYPDSICRHEDPRDPEGKRLASVYSMIMNLTERTLWLSDSNPCKRAFSPFAATAGSAEPERDE